MGLQEVITVEFGTLTQLGRERNISRAGRRAIKPGADDGRNEDLSHGH
jgi:hypothetical protein